MKGLDRMLARIKQHPGKTLVSRYLALVAEVEDAREKTTRALDLAEALVEKDPDEALSVAQMVHHSEPENLRALDVMIASFNVKGRYGKAEVLQNERARLAEQVSTKLMTDANSVQEAESLAIDFAAPTHMLEKNQNPLLEDIPAPAAETTPAEAVEQLKLGVKLRDLFGKPGASHPESFVHAMEASPTAVTLKLGPMANASIAGSTQGTEYGLQNSSVIKRDTTDHSLTDTAVDPAQRAWHAILLEVNRRTPQLIQSQLMQSPTMQLPASAAHSASKAQANLPVSEAELLPTIARLIGERTDPNSLQLIWELLESIGGGPVEPICITILETLHLQDAEPRFFGLYLDALLNAGAWRRALPLMRSMLEKHPHLEWAALIYRRIPACYQKLGFAVFNWSPDEGVAILVARLQQRPRPTMAGAMLQTVKSLNTAS